MKKIFTGLFGLVAIMLLTACEDPQYYVGDTTEQEISKDMYECAVEISNLKHQAFKATALEGLCMESKGYKVVDKRNLKKGTKESEQEELAATSGEDTELHD